jgi:hypothetical protein
MKFISTLLCILAIKGGFFPVHSQTIESELLQMEYAIWQTTSPESKNQAMLKKLDYQLKFDSSYTAIRQGFDRLDYSKLTLQQKLLVTKNRTVFHFQQEEWDEAAQSAYAYLTLKSTPSLQDSMQYYYLNRLALGDLSQDSVWVAFLLDSSRYECFRCLDEALAAIQPARWPKWMNYVVPGSGSMVYGHWKEGLGSLTLNTLGVGSAVLLLSAGLPVNAFFWAGSWEILFYAGSQRAFSTYQMQAEMQKKAGLNVKCQARWENWLQSLQYEPLI